MAKYQILYWFDIPIQVKAKDNTGRYSKELPPRFQTAIDKAAMEADLTDADDYLEGFRWSKARAREGSAEQVATEVASELVREYENIDWRKTVASLTGNS